MAGFDVGSFTSLIPSFFQGTMGAIQGLVGGLNKPQRPVAVVPASVKNATNAAENLASGNMPGYSGIKSQLDLGAGNALNQIKNNSTGTGATGAVADVLGKTNAANIDLGVQNANFKTGALQNLQNQENLQGQYENKTWDYNQRQKYNERASASSALTQASTQNIFDFLNNISGTASYKSLYDNLFPKSQDNTNNPNILGAANMFKKYTDQGFSLNQLLGQ